MKSEVSRYGYLVKQISPNRFCMLVRDRDTGAIKSTTDPDDTTLEICRHDKLSSAVTNYAKNNGYKFVDDYTPFFNI